MLDKKKIYQTSDARIYWRAGIDAWYRIPDGNFLTVWANMGHPSRDRAVCERVIDGSVLTEAEAEREIKEAE